MDEVIKRPALWLHLTEFWRAMSERKKGNQMIEEYMPEQPVKGYPILVIPGFMASPWSTRPLRQMLDRIGFTTYDWGLGRNYANLEDLDKLDQKVSEIHKKHGQKPTIIGWSLGGLYARRLGMIHEDKLRRVITFGSPYYQLKSPNYANWLYQLFQFARRNKEEPEWVGELPKPLSIPTTAYFSKKDGIVPWQACRDPHDPTDHENVEVNGSHIGLGFNEEVLRSLVKILEADSRRTEDVDEIYNQTQAS